VTRFHSRLFLGVLLSLTIFLTGLALPVRAQETDPFETGQINGQALGLDRDDLQSRTACLLVYMDGKAVDLLHYRQDETVYMASLTKMMTAWLAVRLLEDKGRSLDDQATVRPADLEGLAALNASVAGFQTGEVVSYRDLIYGLLISSGCDAANTLARVTAGSLEDFVVQMNEEALRMGLSGTHFANPTGLFHVDNYGTSHDMTRLLGAVIEDDFLKEALSRRRHTTKATNKHPQGITMQHYLTYYGSQAGIDTSGIDGGKTGQLKESGYCLASFKEISGLLFVVCTTGADGPQGHLSDHLALYQAVSDLIGTNPPLVRGIGQPAPLPTESIQTSSPVEGQKKDPATSGQILRLVTLVFLSLLTLLVLALFFFLLVRRRIRKDY